MVLSMDIAENLTSSKIILCLTQAKRKQTCNPAAYYHITHHCVVSSSKWHRPFSQCWNNLSKNKTSYKAVACYMHQTDSFFSFPWVNPLLLIRLPQHLAFEIWIRICQLPGPMHDFLKVVSFAFKAVERKSIHFSCYAPVVRIVRGETLIFFFFH